MSAGRLPRLSAGGRQAVMRLELKRSGGGKKTLIILTFVKKKMRLFNNTIAFRLNYD